MEMVWLLIAVVGYHEATNLQFYEFVSKGDCVRAELVIATLKEDRNRSVITECLEVERRDD